MKKAITDLAFLFLRFCVGMVVGGAILSAAAVWFLLEG